ncbi:MAG: CcmD family protein [Actinomycetota bacterium]
MSDVAWLFIAFMAVWIAIGGYLFSISARQKALDQRLRELDR